MGAKQSIPNTTVAKRKRVNTQHIHDDSKLHTSSATTSPSTLQSNNQSRQSGTPACSEEAKDKFNTIQCQQWFETYAQPDSPTLLSPDGVEHFFSDIGLSVQDLLSLALAWKMNLSHMGYISKDEWMSAMRQLGTESAEDVRDRLADLDQSLRDPGQFSAMYQFAFGYAKNKDQKCMDIDVAIALWSLMLTDRFPLVNDLTVFLEQEHPVKVINRDQWQSVLEFVSSPPDHFDDYDDTSAWPVLIDDFVAWKRRCNSS